MAQNVVKVDTKRTTKKSPKKNSKAVLFICVFLDTKKRKVAHCYSVFYIEIFDFDNFDMIL